MAKTNNAKMPKYSVVIVYISEILKMISQMLKC